MPAPAASPAQSQAPFGTSPVTQPVPNRGYEAAAASRLGPIINNLSMVLNVVGAGSDVGKDILKALTILTKHSPPGSSNPATDKANIDRMAMQNTQNQNNLQAMRQQPQGGGAAMPQQQPMPRAA